MPDWKPGCPEWLTENGSSRAVQQRKNVLRQLVKEDIKRPPSSEMVRRWHLELFKGISPHPDYLGNFRDLDQVPYCLQNCNVKVANILAVPYANVIDEVELFFEHLVPKLEGGQTRWSDMENIPTLDNTDAVVKLAAWAHGEWIWIHPFINGNGRTARLLANYIFTVEPFSFGPIVAIRPRPGSGYSQAAALSMARREHGPMETVFWQLLADSYR